MRPMIALLLLLTASVATAADFTPRLDVRVRQEVLDEVYHFAPEPDRDWIRVRTRFGGRLDAGAHTIDVLLNNEHRHMRTPDQDLTWDELIVDQLNWTWRPAEGRALTIGRQNIIWPGGFLMLEGHPLDGSRSMFHDAVRWRCEHGLDLGLIRNPKYGTLILATDLDADKLLTDADETAAFARVTRGPWAYTVIVKQESDPDDVLDDLRLTTFDLRRTGKTRCGGKWHVELALQHQDGDISVRRNGATATGTGWAHAGDVEISRPLPRAWTARLGAFWYSGLDGDRRPFRSLWGRWPKWSELYIYARLGENTTGRVNVAAWEDIASPWIGIEGPIGGMGKLSLVARHLHSPSTGDARGLLTAAKLQRDLGKGLQAHLLWEMFSPGDYHDGRHGLAPATETMHFIRWQFHWTM